MKKLLFLFAALFFAFVDMKAQSMVDVGAKLSLNSGLSGVTTPTNRKNGFSFASMPNFGLEAMYSFKEDKSIAALFELTYTSYSYLIEDARKDYSGQEYDFELSYLNFGPSVKFGYFLFGFNFGLPMAADFGPEIDTDDLNMLTEFKIGATYPIFEDETGSFNVFMNASYMLSGVYTSFKEKDPLVDLIPVVEPEIPNNEFNPRLVTLSLGFNYLFSL